MNFNSFTFLAISYAAIILLFSLGHTWVIYLCMSLFAIDAISIIFSIVEMVIHEIFSIPSKETFDLVKTKSIRPLTFLIHIFEIIFVYLMFISGYVFIAGIFTFYMSIKIIINLSLIYTFYIRK